MGDDPDSGPTPPTLSTEAAPGLPTGVVTFLLTDIVGSTVLWETYPDRMASVLERHDALVGRTVADHRGLLVKSKGEGDSTLAVFARASDAAAAACAIQASIADEPWPDGINLRVRAALHTGEAHERDGDFFGSTVNRAARLRGLAGGGQILVSEASMTLVRERLPASTCLVDIGRRTLRGLHRAEHVFELRPSTGPPGSPPDVQRPRLVGRVREQATLLAAVEEAISGRPSLTLVAGEAGIGKTTLATSSTRVAGTWGIRVVQGGSDESDRSTLALWRGPRRRLGLSAHAVDTSLPVEELQWEVLGELVEHLAKEAPILVVLEDLHWADDRSLWILQRMVGELTGCAVAIVATCREDPRSSPLPDSFRPRR